MPGILTDTGSDCRTTHSPAEQAYHRAVTDAPPFGPVREPCPHCAEPVALAARICPHCDRPIVLDLWLDAPARDAWARQRLAQQLHGLGPPFPPPADLQPALAARGKPLARGVSRQVAREAQALRW